MGRPEGNSTECQRLRGSGRGGRWFGGRLIGGDDTRTPAVPSDQGEALSHLRMKDEIRNCAVLHPSLSFFSTINFYQFINSVFFFFFHRGPPTGRSTEVKL